MAGEKEICVYSAEQRLEMKKMGKDVDILRMGRRRKKDLSIEDFIPDENELNLLFSNLIPLFSHVLLERHPMVYKSLRSAIVDHCPHQFQEEMTQKSEEFTGVIYEKSECKTEDLISMISDYQKEMVHINKATGVSCQAFDRRQLTGDQKTEKNSHFAILSKADEKTLEDQLAFVLPAHEYFHFMMTIADVESELFRDNTRGLDGGAFSVATLLNRKKARLARGKDDIDSLKDFINIKADARFSHYFLAKFNLNALVDNTPNLLRTGTAEAKRTFLHEKVGKDGKNTGF